MSSLNNKVGPQLTRYILQTKQLCKSLYMGIEQIMILNDINLTISPGESIALIGRSGVGKTTLLSLLSGLDTPSSGEVWLYDIELSQLNEEQRASLRIAYMGFIFQSFYLLEHLNVLDNVMLALELKEKSSNALELTMDILKSVGLQDRYKHYPRQLSGGEQQRVAIARAFVVQPKILFADEPTGNLDQRNSEHIMDLLFDLNKKNNTTIVLVTHELQIAQRCNTIMNLDHGTICAN